jgi:hypothetical protein
MPHTKAKQNFLVEREACSLKCAQTKIENTFTKWCLKVREFVKQVRACWSAVKFVNRF